MQFWTCPSCGANLDHGERCDCGDKKEAAPLQPGTASRTAPEIRYTHTYSVPRMTGSVKEGMRYA